MSSRHLRSCDKMACTFLSLCLYARCTDINTREEYAVKKVVKSSLTDKQAIDDLEREVKILTVLKGRDNIVHFYGAYEDDDAVYMVLEYGPPNLSAVSEGIDMRSVREPDRCALCRYCRGGELFQRLLDKVFCF